MLDTYFNQQLTLVPTMRSVYGDIVIDPNGQQTPVMGRFRVITNTVRVNNRDELRSDDAMFWCASTVGIVQFDILLYEGKYWQVVKVNEARKLGATKIEFLKCSLSNYMVVS